MQFGLFVPRLHRSLCTHLASFVPRLHLHPLAESGLVPLHNPWTGECVRSLLGYNADPNVQSKKGATALMFESNEGHKEVQYLSSKPCRFIASRPWHQEGTRLRLGGIALQIVQSLLNSGADPLIETPSGVTALSMARTAGKDDVRAPSTIHNIHAHHTRTCMACTKFTHTVHSIHK